MAKQKKKIKRRRPFDREALFPNKSVPDKKRAQKEVEKCITRIAEEDKTLRESRIKYLVGMEDELDRLIEKEKAKVVIVDGFGQDLSGVYNILAEMQGNGRGFNS